MPATFTRKMKNILVTGATGHLGTAVLETLLKQMPPGNVAVLTRQKSKHREFINRGIRSHIGSYDDPGSLDNAMQGIDTVLLISSGDQGDRMQEHRNVVDAARKAAVKGIAYTGRCLSDRASLSNQLMAEHFKTEDYIKASGLPYTFFRNVLYMDAIPQFIGGPGALINGIKLPAGKGRVAFAIRTEMGEAVAKVLTREDCLGKTYNLTGSKAFSFYDIAAALTKISGRDVIYTEVDTTEFEGMMKAKNIPGAAISKISAFIEDIRNNQESIVYPDLELILSRQPASLETGLKALFNL